MSSITMIHFLITLLFVFDFLCINNAYDVKFVNNLSKIASDANIKYLIFDTDMGNFRFHLRTYASNYNTNTEYYNKLVLKH